jgi:GH35 family endo-1,4-beta-xylanase
MKLILSAQLYYNDYNIEQGAVENKGKHASSMILLKRLIAEGAPITGVGIQGHWHLNTNLADVEKAIENYASLGLRVSITELDVTATGVIVVLWVQVRAIGPSRQRTIRSRLRYTKSCSKFSCVIQM